MGITGYTRRVVARIFVFLFAGLAVAACQPVAIGGLGGGPTISTRDPIPVALLVPYGSGGAGEETLARSLENAARLAAADLSGVTIDLRVYPTAGNAQRAAAAATQAVNEGAKIILGPVFGEEANAAGLAAASRNINVLAFSNNTAIAGGNVFVLGNTFENTASRLISYGVTQGRTRVLTVYGNTTAGTIGRDAIAGALSRSLAQNVGAVAYEESQQGVIDAIPTIAETARQAAADSVFFTADTLGALPIVTQLLSENGISPQQYQFMGLTRWDIPSGTLALPGVQNGVFALPDPNLTATFQARYQAAYGAAPHPIAGLAYDGIAAVGALAASGNTAALTRGALTQSSGFRGVTGAFRLRSDGTNERALAVARIENRQVIVVSPAPSGFGLAGL